jgi:hypothetical protein
VGAAWRSALAELKMIANWICSPAQGRPLESGEVAFRASHQRHLDFTFIQTMIE